MRRMTLALVIIFSLTLTACGVSSPEPSGSNSQNGFATGALPESTQLIIGILKLDGTPQAVTPDQARQLIPLWQVYKDLANSDNVAQPEIDALVTQIQETLTPNQTQAIAEMKLTLQDMADTMQKMGIAFGRGATASGTQTPGNGGGGFPGGGGSGFPGGGQGNGQQPSQQQIATFPAERTQGSGGFNRTPVGLIDALIEYLQRTAGP